jgi:DeoR/GlpR family transcriptional regulator of sugar metabolism
VEAFTKIHADVAIMSGGGIVLDGVSNSHGLLIDIQRAMINAAQKVIFCFDHTKFGRQSVLPLCGVECIDTIVTDNGAPIELVEQFRAKGIEVVVAPLTPIPQPI